MAYGEKAKQMDILHRNGKCWEREEELREGTWGVRACEAASNLEPDWRGRPLDIGPSPVFKNICMGRNVIVSDEGIVE